MQRGKACRVHSVCGAGSVREVRRIGARGRRRSVGRSGRSAGKRVGGCRLHPGRCQEKTKANNHKVILHHVHEDDFHECNFGAVIERILEKQYKRVYWVGHDVVSGKQAIECKKKYGGKNPLFYHIHYFTFF